MRLCERSHCRSELGFFREENLIFRMRYNVMLIDRFNISDGDLNVS